jgi:hypothetical protein
MVVTLPVILILLDYWPLDRLQSRKIVTNIPEVLPVSSKKEKKKNKLKKEALKKNIPAPNNRKLSEPTIAGIIPIWQLKEKIPFFILSAVLVIITLCNPDDHYTPDVSEYKQLSLISRLANAPVAFVTYLIKTFWPHDMAVFYPFMAKTPLWQVLGAFLLILVMTTFVIIMAKRLPYLFAGWFWFSITIAPVIGIIQISMSTPYTMADRYHYLPSIGLAIGLAWGMPALIKSEAMRKNILFPAGIIFLVIMAFISSNQCGCWKNSITLYDHTLKVTASNWLAYYNRGTFYGLLGNNGQAIADFNKAIEIRPDYIKAYNNRGNAYNELGNYRQAIEDLNRAIANNSGYTEAYYNRGNSYNKLGNYRQAIEDYDRAIQADPKFVKAYYNRASVYLTQGDIISGCRDAQKACELGSCKILGEARDRGHCR